jgi:hypothetical protein
LMPMPRINQNKFFTNRREKNAHSSSIGKG